jgi:hypothetical protein
MAITLTSDDFALQNACPAPHIIRAHAHEAFAHEVSREDFEVVATKLACAERLPPKACLRFANATQFGGEHEVPGLRELLDGIHIGLHAAAVQVEDGLSIRLRRHKQQRRHLEGIFELQSHLFDAEAHALDLADHLHLRLRHRLGGSDGLTHRFRPQTALAGCL